jgi:hypothetical protein
MPPWPGIIFPLSFTPAIRLNLIRLISYRSKTPANKAITVHIKIDLSLKLRLGLMYSFDIK